jgi:hypothetical protein
MAPAVGAVTSLLADVVGHKTLRVTPLGPGAPQKIYPFRDADVFFLTASGPKAATSG